MPNDVINTITLGNTTYDIGGSGHTIEKSDGTDMTQRANLQFVDATITDDSTNNRTKIENVKTITNESELDDLPDGIYIGLTDEGLPFDAGDISYDNTESGLSADKVQGAIDEIDNIITTDETTVEGNPINFSTLSAQNAESTIIDLEPIQDLHGYDKPWVGGAGKNLLPMTVDGIKAINTSGTWSGNVYTINGINITVQTDDADNIIGISTSAGTPSSTIGFNLYTDTGNFLPSGNYTLKGCPRGGSSTTFKQDVIDAVLGHIYALDFGNGGSIQTIEGSNIYCRIVLYAVSLSAMTFYPMIYSNSESDTSFTPYTNICPISGRTEIGILGCGVNVWDEEWEVGGLNAETGEETAATNRIRSKNYIPIVANSSYYCVVPFNSNDIRLCYYDKNKTFVSSSEWLYKGVFTTPQNVSYIRFYVGTVYGTTYNNDISINYPSTDTTYHPYIKSTDLTISLGQTVYGGTLDVENGVLVVDKAIEDLGNLTWSGKDSVNRFYADIVDLKVYSDYEQGILCSHMGIDTKVITNESNADDFTMARYTVGNIKRVYVKCRTISNSSDFTTYVTGMQLVYDVATPTTIQLTPHQISLLEGVNNISTTGDKITLTYRDGKVATLKDIKDSLESSKPVYSTVETVVGTYLNKPLYSKTYQIEFSSSNSYYFDVPSAMDIKFVFGGVYSTRFDFIPFGYGGSGGDMVQCYRFSDTQFRIQNAYYASRMYCDVTLQYTKSTD